MDLKRKLSRLAGVGEPLRDSGTARGGAVSATTAPIVAAPPVTAPARAASVAIAAALDRAARIAELRARIEALRARDVVKIRHRPVVPLAPRALPTVVRETNHGPLYVCATRYQLEHRHGTASLGACLSADAEHVAKLALDPSLASLDPRHLLFFDLETTGLAGGTGTLAFLVGLAAFDGDGLHVEQLFLPKPGAEGPMLRYVGERLAAAGALVSFNGKSFDWPLLRTRFVLNRLPVPPAPPHLDLLHCARRVFRLRLPGVRLVELEREVLGFAREDDIEGAAIAASYFAFLRDGDGEAVAPVFLHNAHDLVALAALLGRVAAMFAATSDGDDPRDRLSLAQVALRAGDPARALAFAQAAAHGSGRYAAHALVLAAEVLRRRGEFARAAELLEEALGAADRSSGQAAQIRLRLAKLYEHKLGDPARALAHAELAPSCEDKTVHARRLARLRRRSSAE